MLTNSIQHTYIYIHIYMLTNWGTHHLSCTAALPRQRPSAETPYSTPLPDCLEKNLKLRDLKGFEGQIKDKVAD